MALHVASKKGNVEMVSFLLKSQQSVLNIKEKQKVPT